MFHTWIHSQFPNLQKGSGYKETSDLDDEYNCIAYAADDLGRWWWPDHDSYWPEGVPREETLEAFIRAYQTVGYERCETAQLEVGFEKVGIYANSQGKPKHAAKQLESGKWTSKLGGGWDIEHDTLEGIEGDSYGSAVQFMKRLTTARRLRPSKTKGTADK